MAYETIVTKKDDCGTYLATITEYAVDGGPRKPIAEIRVVKENGRITLNPPLTAEQYNPPMNFLHRILKGVEEHAEPEKELSGL